MQRSFLAMWERDVVEELEKARVDGWAWKRKYNQGNGTRSKENSDEEFHAYENDRFGDEVEGDIDNADTEMDNLEVSAYDERDENNDYSLIEEEEEISLIAV